MRNLASIGILAAALIASPQVLAQRASLADRVAVLEQRAAGEQNGTELVNQLSQLRSEVQELRGQLEHLFRGGIDFGESAEGDAVVPGRHFFVFIFATKH